MTEAEHKKIRAMNAKTRESEEARHCETLKTSLPMKWRDPQSSSMIVDDDLRFPILRVATVRDSGGGRLVDDTEDIETSNSTSILGSLMLNVVDVCIWM